MTRGSELSSAPSPSRQHLLPATDPFGGPPSLSLPGTRSAGLLYHAVPDTPVTNADILRQAFPSNHPKSDRLQCGDLSSSCCPQPHPCPSEDAGQLDRSPGHSLTPSGLCPAAADDPMWAWTSSPGTSFCDVSDVSSGHWASFKGGDEGCVISLLLPQPPPAISFGAVSPGRSPDSHSHSSLRRASGRLPTLLHSTPQSGPTHSHGGDQAGPVVGRGAVTQPPTPAGAAAAPLISPHIRGAYRSMQPMINQTKTAEQGHCRRPGNPETQGPHASWHHFLLLLFFPIYLLRVFIFLFNNLEPLQYARHCAPGPGGRGWRSEEQNAAAGAWVLA